MPKVATSPGRSTIMCSGCNQYISKYQESAFRRMLRVDCANCGITLDECNMEVHMLPTSAKFKRVQEVRKSEWYHATAVENWFEEVPDDVPIHIGTSAAAMMRWRDINSSSKRPEAGWLYRLRIKPSIPIMRGFGPDDYIDSTYLDSRYSDRVIRYVNIVESVGSVSLLTRKHHFEVVSVKGLTLPR